MTTLLLSIALIALGPAEVLRAADGGRFAEALVLRLETVQPSFELHEPVLLFATVENPTDRIVSAFITSHRGRRSLQFSITGPDGVVRAEPRVEYAGPGELRMIQATDYPPGARQRTLHEISGTAFPQPGRYEVAARTLVNRSPAVSIEAGPVAVEILPPTEKDLEAIQFFASREDFLTLVHEGPRGYCKGKSPPACVEELRDFLRRHPDSAYVPSIMEGLVGWLTIEEGIGMSRANAVEIPRPLLRRRLEHQYPPSFLYRVAIALQDATRTPEALRVGIQFEREYPEMKELIDRLRERIPGLPPPECLNPVFPFPLRQPPCPQDSGPPAGT